jgi:tetratricopeptide (TPR) repeat protein
MESISLEDLDEVDLLLTELEISQGKRNLILCVVASPAYREKIIKVIKSRFSTRITSVETGDNLISDLRNIKPKADKILIWTLPETLSQDVLDALNNFRELFYDAGVPSLIFMTPAGLDGVIWKAPDFWRYRGGYHILKGEDHGEAYQAVEALSIPLRFSYRNKEDLLRRERINEYLLEKIRNKQEREKILAELGSIHSFLGDTGKSIYYFDQALEISRQIGDRQGEASNLAALGQAYVNPGEIRKAIEYFDQALEISRQIGDRQKEVASLASLGQAYAKLGESSKAIKYIEQALMISRQIGDRQKEVASLASLGQAYAKLGESSKAIKYIEQALMISRQIGDRQKEGASLAALGRTYANLGMMHLAIGCYELQLRIAQEIGFIRSEGDALWNMSLALDQLGKKAQAIESAKAALKILGDIEDPQAENVRRKLQEWESQQQKQ